MADLLPQDKQRYGTKVVNIDPENRIVSFDNGSTIKYNKVILFIYIIYFQLSILFVEFSF